MAWYDWCILVVPVAFIMFMGWRSRKYIRSVSDFLVAGRICGRYVICVGGLADGVSILGIVSYIEMHYKTGFSVGFWSYVLAPLTLLLGLTGWCTYRFRETKAMSLGQFLEMRYSRRFRIVAAALRSLSEMLANMIMPALAARFFIQILGLPDYLEIGGVKISMFILLVVFFLTLAITLICWGGTLCLVVTDTIQGILMYPILACFVIFILWKFSVTEEIMPVMMDRVKGESFLNPYDISKLRDFNLFTVVLVPIYGSIMNRANWIGAGYSSAAKTPQEQKMANMLGSWRGAIVGMFYILISCALISFLNHRHFANEANQVRQSLASRVADELLKDNVRQRDMLKQRIQAIPPLVHTIGVDKPLSQDNNLDATFLNEIHTALKEDMRQETEKRLAGLEISEEARRRQLIDAEGQANHLFQQCRTLFHQLSISVTMRKLLPGGLFGLFCLLMFLAMLSTDDTRIYSAALTIAQDVVLPLKKKPFTPEEHVRMIRIVSISIGVFFLLGSFLMSQLDYIHMYAALVCSMWVSGAGPIMVFGLYSRFGTTAGAWTSLGTGMFLSILYVFVQRYWADLVYPFLAKHALVESCDKILRFLSAPFGDYITWRMNAVKCPVNSVEFTFFLSLLTFFLYVVVSKLTCKEPFNLERMLHRGKYSLDGKRELKMEWSLKNIFKIIIGITPEYTRGDRAIAYSVFGYSFVYGFCLRFLGTVIWNAIMPWKINYWSWYFIIVNFVVFGAVTVVSTIWFGIGGITGLIQLFRDLEARTTVNVLDDGRVEGSMSLADKQALEAVDKPAKAP